MAEVKKATTVKKTEEKKVEAVKPAEVKKAEPVKAAEVKKVEPAKAESVKKAAPAKKAAPVKKAAPAKKAASAKKAAPAKKTVTTKKAAATEIVNFEFSGKSYTSEKLIAIAKDVWKFDLQKKVADIKSIELYVKPEENVAYYVINGDVTGSFFI